MQRCVEPSYADYLTTFQCSSTYVALASERAKKQLLPALRILTRQREPPQSAGPSAEKIESLLSLLDNGDDQSETAVTRINPSLRMTFPSPGGRLSGGVVPFIGEVNLGTGLAAKLVSNTKNTSKSGDMGGLTEEQPRLNPQAGSHSSSNSNRGSSVAGSGKPSLPDLDFDRCVVRVIVDGAVASTILVDAAATADDNSDTNSAVAIKTTLTPTYERNVRCSEHPAEAATVAAAAGEGAWADNEVIWRLETRAIDRICTREVFGAHRIYGELACHDGNNSGGPITGYVSS